MIGFFPAFYPDELLYSACARYANQVNYPNKHTAVEELFGSIGFSAIVDFPSRIDYLLSSIPNHDYTSDQIINKNTLLPFYEPFINKEKAKEIRREMKGNKEFHRMKGQYVYKSLTIRWNGRQSISYNRYFLICKLQLKRSSEQARK